MTLRPLLLVVIASLAGFLAAAPSAAAPPNARRVLVLPLQGLGVEPSVLHALDDQLRANVEALGVGPVVSAADTDAWVHRVPCDGRLKCLVALGAAASVTDVVSGSVGTAVDKVTVVLKVIDVTAAREKHRVEEAGPPDRAEAVVRAAATQLLAPERYVGALLVRTDVTGAQVLIDGVARGVTPLLGPLDQLAVGRHELEVTYPDVRGYRAFVEIPFEGTREVRLGVVDGAFVEVAGEPDAARPGPPPLLWVGAGIGGLGLAAITGGIAAWGYRAITAEAVHEGRVTGDEAVRAVEGQRTALNVALPLLIGGTVLAASGAIAASYPLVQRE